MYCNSVYAIWANHPGWHIYLHGIVRADISQEQECIPVRCTTPASEAALRCQCWRVSVPFHRDPLSQRSSFYRHHLSQRSPFTETPLSQRPLHRDPLSQRSPFIETPLSQRHSSQRPLHRDPLHRDPLHRDTPSRETPLLQRHLP